MNQSFARIISIVFHPMLIPTYGIVALLNTNHFHIYPNVYKILAFSVVAVCTFCLPALFLLLMYKLKIIDSPKVEKREQRHIIYLFTLVCHVFCIYLLQKIQMPSWLLMMAICSLAAILAIAVINLFWKISIHATAAGCFVGGTLFTAYLLKINPITFIIFVVLIGALVMTARLTLKAHSIAQVICGYLLGAAFMLFLPFILTQI